MARSFSSSKISIWWDIENCHVPRNVDPNYIAQNLRSALHRVNLNGPITIDVFGDTRNLEHRILEALSSTGITINHIPSGNKDAADKAILVAMLFWALDNPPPAHLLLISGDGDFANALHRLRLKGYDILLARPDQPVKPALLGAATSVWYWTSVSKGHIPLPEEEKSAHEDSSGIKARASRVSTDEDAQNIHYRVTPVQRTDAGEMTSFKVSGTHDVTSETNNFSFGEQHSSISEIDMSPTVSTHSRVSEHHITRNVIQENGKLTGDTTQSESNLYAQRAKLVSHSPTLNTVNTNKQLYDLAQHSAQSGIGGTHVSKQSHDGHVSSNKITDFNTKGPPGISLSIPSMRGHLQGLSQDAQRAYNPNILKVMKTFERLKMDCLLPTLDNLQNCLCYWDRQNKKVNLKQVLDQALNLGHVEKASGVMGGDTIFLPIKTELWSCFDVRDMHYAFSDMLTKDFHQFLCCSKNWQFFVHSQSMYEAAQRLKKDGPTEIRDLAIGEIINFLNQAIWKWKWLGLENTPTFLLSIKSQAIFVQSPIQTLGSVPSKSSQPEKDVPRHVSSRHTGDDTSRILKRLRGWLKETANSRTDYDVSLVPKDFQCATGIKLDIQKLGFSRLQELLEEFSDDVKIQVVRKGLKILCPAVAVAQDKGILSTSQDKQQKGLLPSPQDNDLKRPAGSAGSIVYVQEKQSFTQSKEASTSHRSVPSAIVTSQHVGASHVGTTQAFFERPVGKNHPLIKKLRNWLLQLPSLKQGYDLSLIKKDFYQATGMVLDSPSLGYFKVKDIVNIFPDDFHVESPRPGLYLLFSSSKTMPATKSNVSSNRHTGEGENLERLVSDGTLSKLPQVKSKAGSVQWKELHSSVKTVDGKPSRTVEITKEELVATIASTQVVRTDSLPLNGGQFSSNAELLTKELDEPIGLTSSIS